nr:DUF559 domain-containing protein [Mesorhizobium sp. YC-2]
MFVEIDGSQHADSETDKIRQAELKARGFVCCVFGTTMF